MNKDRRRGIAWSGAAHTVVILLLLVGLPTLIEPKRIEEPLVITVDILPVTDKTNVKTSEAKPAPKESPEEKKPEAKKPTPIVKTADSTPPPPPPKPPEEKAEKPKEEKKPEPPKPEKKEEKKEKKEDDLLAILKAVKESANKEKADKPEKVKEETSPNKAKGLVPYDPTIPISLGVRDAIKQQLMKCWTFNAGGKDAYKLVVEIELYYNADATLLKAEYTAKTKARMAETNYLVAAESAMRAVQKPDCNPLKGLPADKYEGWSYMLFTFDPSEMTY